MPLTHTQTWGAVAYLEASGLEPTPAAVHKTFGRGNNSTHSSALAECLSDSYASFTAALEGQRLVFRVARIGRCAATSTCPKVEP